MVAVSVFYDVGMRNEPEGRTGFAHLFEHMMFQGSANVPKMEHARLVQAAGGTFNGSTHQDYTNYYEALPAEALERALFLEADRMAAPAITEENLRNQIDVVKEEIRVNVLNRPYGAFPWLQLPQIAFDSFANTHDGYGSFVDLESSTVDDATDFFSRYYAPGNAVLCIGGDLDVAETERLIQRWFGPVAARPVPPDPADRRADAHRGRRRSSRTPSPRAGRRPRLAGARPDRRLRPLPRHRAAGRAAQRGRRLPPGAPAGPRRPDRDRAEQLRRPVRRPVRRPRRDAAHHPGAPPRRRAGGAGCSPRCTRRWRGSPPTASAPTSWPACRPAPRRSCCGRPTPCWAARWASPPPRSSTAVPSWPASCRPAGRGHPRPGAGRRPATWTPTPRGARAARHGRTPMTAVLDLSLVPPLGEPRPQPVPEAQRDDAAQRPPRGRRAAARRAADRAAPAGALRGGDAAAAARSPRPRCCPARSCWDGDARPDRHRRAAAEPRRRAVGVHRPRPAALRHHAAAGGLEPVLGLLAELLTDATYPTTGSRASGTAWPSGSPSPAPSRA